MGKRTLTCKACRQADRRRPHVEGDGIFLRGPQTKVSDARKTCLQPDMTAHDALGYLEALPLVGIAEVR